MAQTKNFTTSAKVLTSYVETKAVHKLCEAFGQRLTELTQEEKYQLATAFALMLWGCCDSGIGEGAEPDEFEDLFETDDSDKDLLETTQHQLMPEVSGNVKAALIILQNEEPEILAQLLPAIAEYARDDDR